MKCDMKSQKSSLMTILSLAMMMILICSVPGMAQEKLLPPGQYISEGGWGQLFIKQGRDGALMFSIKAVVGNAHACDLEGRIRNGMASLKEEGMGKACIVTFSYQGNGVNVTSDGGDDCRYYCGARANFEGFYLKPLPGCGQADLRKTRNEFKKLYDKKNYAQARLKLEAVLKDCAKTMDWLELGWVRNDLAVTQYKLLDFVACRKTLQPLAGDAAKTKDQIFEAYPPADAESYMPIVNAARANLKLCNQGIKK
ncbi:MAG: hypothetical protein CSYNP_00153 [Syntrophus sp. SKADARSKE-3]|nr:hypothetical protein [Syntrophus sp. SKADARSKE-3]